MFDGASWVFWSVILSSIIEMFLISMKKVKEKLTDTQITDLVVSLPGKSLIYFIITP